MSQVLARAKPQQSNKLQHPFLQELVKQIRLADILGKYQNWSDELLVNQLIIAPKTEAISSRKLNFDPLSQLLIDGFYHALGAEIEKQTGYPTETYVHLRNKEFSSAVICCGGVLVLYSLIWGYKSFGFLSLHKLIESAETNINGAVTKANLYLDF